MKNILGRIFFGLAVALVSLGIADYFLPDSFWLTDYIRGSFTETFGIVITLIFVERIVSAQQKKDERSEEIKQIKRLHRILGVELQKCIIYASFLTQKAGEQNYEVSRNFDFNRLENFHIPSLSIFDGSEKAHKLIAKCVERILITMREALINYDFRYFQTIENLLMEYIEFMSIGAPFGALELLEHNPGIQKSMREMIEAIPVGTIPKYEDYPSNSMVSFIRLYEVINFHIDFKLRYEAAVLRICTKI